MNMEQKNEMIKNYIIDLANKLNNQYKDILPKEKIDRAITMFTDSEKSYEELIENINQQTQQTVVNYLKSFEQQKNIDQRNSRTFEQIKFVHQKVQQILESSGIKIYTAGGSVPYLLLNQDSNRLHDDIDTVCNLDDMQKLREIFKSVGLYDPNWDSMNYAKDGKDYGFEMKIDGVPFGIYPFEYQNGELIQYSYDPYNTLCKIKHLTLEQLSDYVMTYSDTKGNIYNTMSLEFIKMTKDISGREKDIIDSKKISETKLLRQEVLNRIKMYKEVQKTEADKLEKNNTQLTTKKDENTKTKEKIAFDKRSESEIQIAKQIKEKNLIIKQQKEQQRTLNKPKVKTLTINNNNGSTSGFANTLILTLIIGILIGAICMVIYYIFK